MKRKLVFFVSMMIFLGGIVQAQNEKDGLSKLNQKDYKAAKNIFAGLLKKDPKNAVALYGMGEYYYYSGKMDSAKIFYQNGIDASGSYAYNYVGLGKINYLSNPAESESNFKDAVKKSKKDAGAIVSIARFYYELNPKKIKEAVHYIDMAIAQDPENSPAYIMNGLIELDKGNIGEAALQFDRAIHFDPNQMESYLSASKIMVSARNYQQAVDYINRAIAVNPKYWPAYKNLGELYYDNQKYDNAVKNYEIYFKNVPEDKDVTLYAYSLFFNKQYKEAHEMLDKLLAQNPNDYILYRLLGYISYETKDLTNGKLVMDKFFKLAPPDKILVDDYAYYGKMLSAIGNDSLAIVNYNLALKKDPTQIQMLDEIAKSYTKQKKYDLALQTSTEYLKQKPNVSTVDYFQLGKAYYTTANSLGAKPDSLHLHDAKADSIKQISYYIQADTLFSKVVKFSPNSYLGPFWRGRVNSAIDKETTLGLAKPYYEKALLTLVKDSIKYKKEVTEIYSYLGFYYYVKDDKTASIQYWKKLLELDPENAKALEAIKLLEKKK